MNQIPEEQKTQFQEMEQYQLNEQLENSCRFGYVEVVKYLLTSPDLKEHADVHSKYDLPFRLACVAGKMEVIEYLIFGCNIKKSAYIDKYLKREPNQQIEDMFSLREVKIKLDENLPLNAEKNNKIKL